MAEHLPILLVILPLLAAPLCVVFRNHRVVGAFAAPVTWITFAIAIAILRQVHAGGPLTYDLGGWAPPWGIGYRIDALSAFLAVIVAGNAVVILPYALLSLTREIPQRQHYLMHALFLLCVAGLLGICVTGDLFNVFVFLEIASLSSYVLISMGTGRRAFTAAFQYLIMGTIGSTFILIGIGMAYMMTGTLNMADLAARLPDVEQARTVICAFAFLTVGISIKTALFPLHTWLPNAYTYAPSAVSAFIASTSTKVSFYLFLRVIFTVFGIGFAFYDHRLDRLLMPLALVAIFVASTVAIYQTNLKRLLAFSSVAQIGYMVLGLSFASLNGLTGSIVHLFNHALMKGGLFLAVGCIMFRVGSVDLKDLRGIGKRMPLTMAAFVVGGLNLIGVPLTAGFVSKWYFVLAAIERGLWPVAALTLLSSLLAVVYIWRVVEVAYFLPQSGESKVDLVREAPPGLLIPTWIMIGATLVFGIWAEIPVGAARAAASVLVGGTP